MNTHITFHGYSEAEIRLWCEQNEAVLPLLFAATGQTPYRDGEFLGGIPVGVVVVEGEWPAAELPLWRDGVSVHHSEGRNYGFGGDRYSVLLRGEWAGLDSPYRYARRWYDCPACGSPKDAAGLPFVYKLYCQMCGQYSAVPMGE